VIGFLTQLTTLTSPGQYATKILPAPLPAHRVVTARHAKAAELRFATAETAPLPCANGYWIASLLPDTAAFLTSLSWRTPLSYVASHADSSSSAGSVKLR
jgi:hypothetical protein